MSHRRSSVRRRRSDPIPLELKPLWGDWSVSWLGECQRCFTDPGDGCWVPSFFDMVPICVRCYKLESSHRDHEMAVLVEEHELSRGNASFRGIGLPDDLQVVADVMRQERDLRNAKVV